MFLQIEVTRILSVSFLNTKDFRKKGKNDFDIIGDGHICGISKQNSFNLFKFVIIDHLFMISSCLINRESN